MGTLFEYSSQKLLYYEHMSYLQPFLGRRFEKHPVLGQGKMLCMHSFDGHNSQTCLDNESRIFVENWSKVPPSDVDSTNEFR